MTPQISVIIPVLNEQAIINTTLGRLRCLALSERIEIIVVDGGDTAGTLSAIQDRRVQKIQSPPGRGVQLRAGAECARGRYLLFLHADTRLPDRAFMEIISRMKDPRTAFTAFDLGLDDNRWVFRLIGAGASLRSRLTGVPYGDQALCVKRTWYDRIGGIKPWPLMEDVDLVFRLRQASGKAGFISLKVRTSSRRWKKEGVLRCTFRNWMIFILFRLGVSPWILKKLYTD